jgi:hypothetical protein
LAFVVLTQPLARWVDSGTQGRLQRNARQLHEPVAATCGQPPSGGLESRVLHRLVELEFSELLVTLSSWHILVEAAGGVTSRLVSEDVQPGRRIRGVLDENLFR